MVKVNTNDIHGNHTVRGTKTGSTSGASSRSIPTKELKASLGGDTVNFSGRGAEFGKLVDQLKGMPDTRQDRVMELKQKIAAGQYAPSSDDIAAAIMRDEQ